MQTIVNNSYSKVFFKIKSLKKKKIKKKIGDVQKVRLKNVHCANYGKGNI